MMEAASTFQSSVNFYHNTWRNNPEDIHLHRVLGAQLATRKANYLICELYSYLTYLLKQPLTTLTAVCHIRPRVPDHISMINKADLLVNLENLHFDEKVAASFILFCALKTRDSPKYTILTTYTSRRYLINRGLLKIIRFYIVSNLLPYLEPNSNYMYPPLTIRFHATFRVNTDY
jgi:hypothetical protein